MIVSAWHTPGKELKIETNLPEVQSMKVTSAGPTKKFEFNGKEVATVDFDSSSKKASHTMHLPSGKDLTIDLAWPKMTPAASDLEFGVTITPDKEGGHQVRLGDGRSEEGLPGCCRQQPLDGRSTTGPPATTTSQGPTGPPSPTPPGGCKCEPCKII